MCAMLALVAGEELGLKKRRIMAFLDAYIGKMFVWELFIVWYSRNYGN